MHNINKIYEDIKMNYKKVYDALIIKAQNENRIKGQGIYYETHHIIPKCYGGSNKKYT